MRRGVRRWECTRVSLLLVKVRRYIFECFSRLCCALHKTGIESFKAPVRLAMKKSLDGVLCIVWEDTVFNHDIYLVLMNHGWTLIYHERATHLLKQDLLTVKKKKTK